MFDSGIAAEGMTDRVPMATRVTFETNVHSISILDVEIQAQLQ